MGGALWKLGFQKISPCQSGSESAENETGLCGYFLSSQKRPKDAGGREHDGAGSGGEKRKGSLCRHFQL